MSPKLWNKMKRAVFLMVVMVLQYSCSLETSSDEPSFYFETMPMESVELPLEFNYGETYTVNVSYEVPSNCYNFSDIYIENNGNTRTIAVINSVISDRICEPFNDRLAVASFDLKIESRDSYVLRFWKGKDLNGQDNYYIVEIPVTDG